MTRYRSCRLRLQPHLEGAKRAGAKQGSRRLPLPSARQASWMLLQPEELKEEEQKIVELLCRLSPEIGRAQELALNFVEMIKERRADELPQWLIDVLGSGVAEFQSFANGLTDDLQAVKAALCSSGQGGALL